jgi:hypothetical protein
MMGHKRSESASGAVNPAPARLPFGSTGAATQTVDASPAPGRLVFCGAPGVVLFAIHADGSIERGPGFTTTDEMSRKFWDTVEQWRPR